MCAWKLKRVPTFGLLEDKGGQWKRAGWTWDIQRDPFQCVIVKTLPIVPVFLVPIPWRSCSCLLFKTISSCMCDTIISYPSFLYSWSRDRHTPVGDWFLNCKCSIIHLSPYGGGWWDHCLAKWQVFVLNDQSTWVRMEEGVEIITLLNGNWSTCMKKTGSWSIEGFSIVKTRKMLIKRKDSRSSNKKTTIQNNSSSLQSSTFVRTVYYSDKP